MLYIAHYKLNSLIQFLKSFMKKQIILSAFILLTLITQAATGPKLAGLTYAGGSYGIGAIIKYTGGDTTDTYYSLPGGGCPGCGASPSGSLILASDGKMYGLSYNDGSNYAGTVFQYDYPANTYTIMANFYYPTGSLIQASNGLLYGTTTSGGANGKGTIFSYTLGGSTVTPLASLPAQSFTGNGTALVQAADSNLYGMTTAGGTNGGGIIYQYKISTNTFAALYDLPASAGPWGELLQVGADTLYGMTRSDGTHSGGTIFRFVPASLGYTVLYNFDSTSGAGPYASLIRATDGKLYGTTYKLGLHQNGTIFSYDLSAATLTRLHDFNDTIGGGSPQGSLYQATDGLLYGMTGLGGEYGDGTIYSYNIQTSTFSAPFSFDFTDGAQPQFTHLIEYGSVVAIVITTQPVAQAVCAGSIATYKVSATGYTTIQWQVSSGSAYINIPGETDSIYSFLAVSAENGNLYRAVLTGSNGNDTTTPVSLTVYAAAQSSITASVCPGQGYTVGTHTYNVSGTYTDTITAASVHGCDSIVVLNLVVTTMNDTATVSGATCTVTGNGATYQWYSCADGSAISGAIFSTYTATANGSYFCIVALGNCTDSTNCVTVTGVGVHDLATYHFALYPNPTSGTFIIDNNYTGMLTIDVVNMLGEKVRSFTMNAAHAQFDISGLAAGIYEVHIATGGQTRKVFKLGKD
jgi:uncharacterized repeat protein (TIGR03803 family)